MNCFWLGVDVSKKKLDIALLDERGKVKQRVLSNDAAGVEQLQRWLHERGAMPTNTRICMEAAGPYSEVSATALCDADWVVAVVNPERIKGFAQTQMVRNKTDSADATLLARFGAQMRPEPWQPPPVHVRELRGLVDRLQTLKDMQQQELNRLEAHAGNPVLLASINEHVDWLKRCAADLQRQIDDHIDGHPQLRLEAELINSFPGLGQITTPKVLAFLGDVRRFKNAKALAAVIGVTPKLRESGIRPAKGDSVAGTVDRASRLPKFEAAGLYEEAPKDMNGLSLGVDAFAGAEGGITLGGKVQWLPPKEAGFVSFAEVSGDVAGSIGAGFKGQFEVYLRDGKFRIKAAARLCWGLGAKGAVEFTVNAHFMEKFVEWLFYQLLHAGFKQLVYFHKAAFQALSQLIVVCLADGSDAEKAWVEMASNVDRYFNRTLEALENAKKRDALVSNINRKPHWLTYATPETRGMLLYQITRHGTASHMRDAPSAAESSLTDLQLHYLPSHKQAVCNVMAGIQTASGWHNVMQHMTADGDKSSRLPGTNEGDVVRFLNNGVSLADLPSVFKAVNEARPQNEDIKQGPTGNKFLNDYLTMRGKCLHKFPTGYKVARLDSSEFEGLRPFDGDRATWFAQLDTRGLGEAMAGDPGSNLA